MSSGNAILQLAADHIGEPYIFGARAPMNNSGWRGPWDCAEFVSWCVFQTTRILYGTVPKNDPILADAYTGYWAQQATADSAYISVEAAARIPGACVLRIPSSLGAGHIVFSDGAGGTLEAHSTAKGVCRQSLSGRRWDSGILVPGVQYFTNILPPDSIVSNPTGIILRVTSPLMQGSLVQEVQEKLASQGYFPGAIDGIYGAQVESAVIAFQAANGLVPDGEVGVLTFAALGIAV